jgi:hypothetical protein
MTALFVDYPDVTGVARYKLRPILIPLHDRHIADLYMDRSFAYYLCGLARHKGSLCRGNRVVVS